ncbi:MAG: hypothetical protein PUI16_08615 [Clostridia bacterium]|nr:hypothetical protein [Clostridia bacterium]MDY5554276.1 hypothetical protein [Blautia sp.]
MDKEEFRIKLEEINKLVQNKDYKGAMDIVDSIDWRRVKNVRTLCVVGEIYAANGRYEDSKEIFLLAYHKASIGKNILYRLIEISLKMNDIDEAMEFFDEYKEIAPNDNSQYILQYKIARARNASVNEQIRILEEYKEQEFTEKWSYELAALYYKAGDKQKCLDLCNEIILWFSEGKYVMKAYDLKMRMGELTGKEKEKYEQQFIPKLITPEEAEKMELQKSESSNDDNDKKEEHSLSGNGEIRNDIESIPMDERDLNNIESIQEKISKGIRDIFNGKKKNEEEESEQIDSESENVTVKEDEIPEEIIKKDSFVDKISESAPDLEKEFSRPGENPVIKNTDTKDDDIAQPIKMPELNIPESMKNINLENTKAENINITSNENQGKKEEDSFNLEDTILAAATAQGIKIPMGNLEEPDFLTEKNVKSEEEDKITDKNIEKAEDFEEDENLTEEDLRSAEEEFLHGPVTREDINLEDLNEKEEKNLTEEEQLERFIESLDSKDKSDPLEIIPREKELRDYEKQLFTYFVKVPGMKEQLLDTLCDVQAAAADKTSKTGNIIVMGGKECGKTRLISGLIPAICKELNLDASKVAYVFAEQINGKNIYKIFSKLAGGFLVIENANQLTQDTVDMLDKAMEADTEGLTVIVEDEKIGMRKMIARFPKFAKKFTSMINIPVFTNDELVNFARVYTKENGYTIDQMGMLALYNLIGINQKEDQPMTVGAVKELIDTAIAKSQGGIRKFKRNISKKRTDHDGYIVLYEKDFVK